MKKQSPFTGKSIKLLVPFQRLSFDAETGEIHNAEGKLLEFGKDYLLVEGWGDDSVCVYNLHNDLIHEFKIEL